MKVEPKDLRLDSGLGPKDLGLDLRLGPKDLGLDSRLGPKDLGLDLDLTEVTCMHLWSDGSIVRRSDRRQQW